MSLNGGNTLKEEKKDIFSFQHMQQWTSESPFLKTTKFYLNLLGSRGNFPSIFIYNNSWQRGLTNGESFHEENHRIYFYRVGKWPAENTLRNLSYTYCYMINLNNPFYITYLRETIAEAALSLRFMYLK